jgi:hypothetical protein
MGTPAYLINIADAADVEDNPLHPVTPVTGSYYLIASGIAPINAVSVRLYEDSTGTYDDHFVYRARDLQGNTIYLAKLIGAAFSPTATSAPARPSPLVPCCWWPVTA